MRVNERHREKDILFRDCGGGVFFRAGPLIRCRRADERGGRRGRTSKGFFPWLFFHFL